MPSETWRVVLASGEVREVVVTQRGDGQWVAVLSGGTRKRHGFSASSAVWTACPAGAREILAPNDPTRAELAAQLAAVTAERDALRAEVSRG